jgi:NAD(P)H-nitrite reductase large subunit
MISAESYLPINRPMLTKSMLASLEADQISIHDAAWFKEKRIDIQLAKFVTNINPNDKIVTLNHDEKLSYDKLIYALGAECFVPPIPGHDKREVITIRHVEDIVKISTMLDNVKNVIVIGGGVLGLEAAWEMKKSKCKVTVLELAPQLMGRQLDQGTAATLMQLGKAQGIEIMTGVKILGIEGTDSLSGVKLGDDTVIPADLVILSTGISANIAPAKDAGLEPERAIVVDDTMATNVPDIYACGDCVQFHGVNYAIWPEALEQGKVAGACAAGDSLAYQGVSTGLSFHGMGTALFAIGDVGKDSNKSYKTVDFSDDTKHEYEKYWFVNGQLTGAILLGNVDKIASVTEAVEQHKLFKQMF